MKQLALVSLTMVALLDGARQTVTLPGKSPLVTFRIVFQTGAASDPVGKAGLAALTANLLTEGGTKHRTYKQIVEALYPMATSIASQVDKEMMSITATTHIDNLEAFYGIFKEMLLEPGWRTEDFERLRANQMNYVRVSLRGNNDEELGKEVLYERIYAGHPYGHVNEGDVSDLQSMTIDDLRNFYAANLTQANLTIGIAGGYPDGFGARMHKDFAAKLAKGSGERPTVSAPKVSKNIMVTLVEKPTRSVAYSLGHAISVRRGHPDYAALLVAQSYLGYHRSGGRLFERMREERGLNYGDYAYIEYFPRGMFQFEPDPNLARQQQIFQIWIRPVEPETAHFALRLALYELARLIKEGIPPDGFERTRNFLSKNVNLLLKTKDAELGYLIDSGYYGIPEYGKYLKSSLAKLAIDDVNAAVRKHLRADGLHIVAIGQGMEAFKSRLLAGDASPMTYNSPKPDEIVKEDKVVASWKLPVTAENIRIMPVDKVFE